MERPTTDFSGIQTVMMNTLAFQAILECVRVKAFDVFEARTVSAAEFAEQQGFQLRQTEGLLDMLSAYGLLEKTERGYSNTRLSSEHLVTTSAQYQGRSLELHSRFNASMISDMSGFLKGRPDARRSCDDNWALRDTLEGTAAHARLGALQDTVDFAAALPGFPSMRSMCDIGGNHGEFSMSLLARNPDLRGVVADLPEVTRTANEYIAEKGFADRLRAVPCDLRKDALPEDEYDLVLTSHVLYAFMDDLASLFVGIRKSLAPGGWFVAQHMDPDGGDPLEYSSTVNFCATMAGYETHQIGRDRLERELVGAGFAGFRCAPAGLRGGGLIVAAQRPVE